MKRLFILLLVVLGCAAHAGESGVGQEVSQHWKNAERFSNMNDFEKAIEEYTAAIELDEQIRGDRQYDIYNDRGRANFFLGKYEAALSDFTTVLNRASFGHALGTVNIARALKRRAEIYKIVDLREEAKEDLAALAFIQTLMLKMDKMVKQSVITAVSSERNNRSYDTSPSLLFCRAEQRYMPNLVLVENSQKDINREREAASQSWDEVNGHLYDLAREAMNLNFGDAAHHAIQAGSCILDALEHSREADRMEQESNTITEHSNEGSMDRSNEGSR